MAVRQAIVNDRAVLRLAERLNTALAEATDEQMRLAMPALHAVEARIKGLTPDPTV